MLEILDDGIDIRRHYIPGVYTCVMGKDRKPVSDPPAQEICTLRECPPEEDDDLDHPEPGPIELTYQGLHATLRLWDPYSCVLAASIHKCLIHFPIRRGSCVFAIGCDLKTLGHVSDVLGRSGRVIAVLSDTTGSQKPPSAEQLRKFSRMYPRATVVSVDVQCASFEGYQRLLSLPESSKYAFLMGLHPRLGEKSAVRHLAADRERIVSKIFNFLICNDVADVKCLVACQWKPGTRVDVIREIVLSHIDIFQQWRTRFKKDEEPAAGELSREPTRNEDPRSGAEAGGEGGDSSDNEDAERVGGMGGMTTAEVRKKARKRSKEEVDFLTKWVFLDIPSDSMVDNSSSDEVIGLMRRLTSGLRTGLLVKEQLLLAPYFPKHSLLLLKYQAHRDQRTKKLTKHRFPLPPGLEESFAEAKEERTKRAKEPADSGRETAMQVEEAPPRRQPKEAEEPREVREVPAPPALPREPREAKEAKAPKEQKEPKEPREAKSAKARPQQDGPGSSSATVREALEALRRQGEARHQQQEAATPSASSGRDAFEAFREAATAQPPPRGLGLGEAQRGGGAGCGGDRGGGAPTLANMPVPAFGGGGRMQAPGAPSAAQLASMPPGLLRQMVANDQYEAASGSPTAQIAAMHPALLRQRAEREQFEAQLASMPPALLRQLVGGDYEAHLASLQPGLLRQFADRDFEAAQASALAAERYGPPAGMEPPGMAPGPAGYLAAARALGQGRYGPGGCGVGSGLGQTAAEALLGGSAGAMVPSSHMALGSTNIGAGLQAAASFDHPGLGISPDLLAQRMHGRQRYPGPPDLQGFGGHDGGRMPPGMGQYGAPPGMGPPPGLSQGMRDSYELASGLSPGLWDSYDLAAGLQAQQAAQWQQQRAPCMSWKGALGGKGGAGPASGKRGGFGKGGPVTAYGGGSMPPGQPAASLADLPLERLQQLQALGCLPAGVTRLDQLSQSAISL